MTQRFHWARILPATIAGLAVVLVARTGLLVREAIEPGQVAAVIAAAQAAGPDAAAKPAAAAATPAAATAAPAKPPAAEATRPPAADTPPVPTGPAPMTEGEKSVLLDLRARREQLDAREAALASRESMLVAAEKQLSARIAELQALQQHLEALESSHQQQENAAWQGLVKVYEDMKPRDAAAIFNDLGMPVLLSVIDRMKEAKAAAILAAMLPDKARDVTTQLALRRTRPVTAPDPANAPPSPPRAAGSGT